MSLIQDALKRRQQESSQLENPDADPNTPQPELPGNVHLAPPATEDKTPAAEPDHGETEAAKTMPVKAAVEKPRPGPGRAWCHCLRHRILAAVLYQLVCAFVPDDSPRRRLAARRTGRKQGGAGQPPPTATKRQGQLHQRRAGAAGLRADRCDACAEHPTGRAPCAPVPCCCPDACAEPPGRNRCACRQAAVRPRQPRPGRAPAAVAGPRRPPSRGTRRRASPASAEAAPDPAPAPAGGTAKPVAGPLPSRQPELGNPRSAIVKLPRSSGESHNMAPSKRENVEPEGKKGKIVDEDGIKLKKARKCAH